MSTEEITTESLWRTEYGTLVRICDMSDRHLLATIRMLRGRSPIGTKFKCDPIRRRQWLNTMANEAYSRGLALDPLEANELVHE